MQTKTDVCNLALTYIGGGRIQAFGTTDTKEARQCLVSFDAVKNALLRSHHWNFAVKRAVLAPDATAPAFGFAYAYSLPEDCVRALKDPQVDWAIEGRKIVTDYGTVLNLRYIADVDEPGLWDPSFYNLFALDLAMVLAKPLSASSATVQELYVRRKDALAEARRSNSWERAQDSEPTPLLWEARL